MKNIRVNERIRIPEIRVIGADAEQLGILPTSKALSMAQEQGLDLVEVAPNNKPPVCRIMDFSKYKYDQEKKERRVKKNQKITHLKQIRLKPNIDEHDYQIKVRQVIAFLDKKDKVKVNLFFRGREMAFKEKGRTLLAKVVADTLEHGTVEQAPLMEGRIMSVLIGPKADKN